MNIIELMVAMAIGLIIAAGLSIMFANSSRTNRELESATRQIENGRFAVDLLAQELAVAGFYWDTDPTGVTFTSPDPCTIDPSQFGWDAATKKQPYPLEGKSAAALAALPCVAQPASGVAGLLLRRVAAEETPVGAIDSSKRHAYLQTSQCNADTVVPFVFSTDPSALNQRNLACSGLASARQYMSRLYYVATCNECSGAGADTIPTLKRVELNGQSIVTTPLATGVERFAVEYGFDTNGDGVPDVYEDVGGTNALANKWSDVVAARVYVLARSNSPTLDHVDDKSYNLGLAGTVGPFGDGYKRKVFVTGVKIQNVAGPRER